MFKFRTGLEVLEKLGSFFAFFPFSSFYSTPILCFLFHLSYNIPSSISTCVLSCFSPVQIFATLWTVAHQVPLSMGFPRQEYTELSKKDLHDPGNHDGVITDPCPQMPSNALILTWVSRTATHLACTCMAANRPVFGSLYLQGMG